MTFLPCVKEEESEGSHLSLVSGQLIVAALESAEGSFEPFRGRNDPMSLPVWVTLGPRAMIAFPEVSAWQPGVFALIQRGNGDRRVNISRTKLHNALQHGQ